MSLLSKLKKEATQNQCYELLYAMSSLRPEDEDSWNPDEYERARAEVLKDFFEDRNSNDPITSGRFWIVAPFILNPTKPLPPPKDDLELALRQEAFPTLNQRILAKVVNRRTQNQMGS